MARHGGKVIRISSNPGRSNLLSAREHRVEHVLGQAAGERILLTHVIGAQDCEPRFQRHLDAMAKFRSWFHTQMLGNCLIPDTPKRNDHTKLAQVFELASKERTTAWPVRRVWVYSLEVRI